MTEKWKTISGYDLPYQISSLGRVRILDYIDKSGHKRRTHYHKGGYNNGYHHVTLRKNNRKFTKKVHQLVAEYFIDNPYNYPVINHINRNRSDNRIENLEWCTHLHNLEHSNVSRKGNEANAKSVSIYKDGTLVKTFDTIAKCATYLDRSRRTVNDVLAGRHKLCNGHEVRYV